jgi:hypothetical protein
MSVKPQSKCLEDPFVSDLLSDTLFERVPNLCHSPLKIIVKWTDFRLGWQLIVYCGASHGEQLAVDWELRRCIVIVTSRE